MSATAAARRQNLGKIAHAPYQRNKRDFNQSRFRHGCKSSPENGPEASNRMLFINHCK
jgi:hypothetical protein